MRRTTTTPHPLSDAWRIVRAHLAVAVSLTVVAGAVAAVVTATQPIRYRSTVTLVVGSTSGRTDTETLVRTMSALLTSDAMGADLARAASVELEPKEVASRVSVERPPGSGVLTVTVEDTDRLRSRVIAQTLGPVFARRVNELLEFPAPAIAGEEPTRFFVRSWDPAPMTEADEPPVTRNGVVGGLLGAALSAVLIAFVEQQRNPIRSARDAASVLGGPVVATLPRFATRWRRRWNERSVVAVLAERLGQPPGGTSGSIALVPVRRSKEHDRLALRLALALSAEGAVTLVDADPERAGVSKLLSYGHADGLSDALAAASPDNPGSSDRAPDAKASKRISPLELPRVDRKAVGDTDDIAVNLRFVPAGSARHAAKLASRRVVDALRGLSERGRIVITTPPPTEDVPIGNVLRAVDRILVTAVADETSHAEAVLAAEALGVQPDGVVVLRASKVQLADAGPVGDVNALARTDAPREPRGYIRSG